MSKRRSVLIFVGLAYSLAWMIWLGLRFWGIQLGQSFAQLGTMLAMWMPALAFFILRAMKSADVPLQEYTPSFKNGLRYYLTALWLPTILSLFGAGLYFMIFKNQFNLGFEYLQSMLEATGHFKKSIPLQLVAVSQLFSAMTFAPVFNSLLALGEEIGWRGYLYPVLRERFSLLQTHLLVGLIWSLWHLPINL